MRLQRTAFTWNSRFPVRIAFFLNKQSNLRRRIMLIGIALLLVFSCTFVYAVPVMRSAVHFAFWRLLTDTTVSSQYAQNGDVQIHYTSYGVGPALFLLHGGLSSGLDWIGEIPALADKFKLVVVDSRGHGKSDLGTEPLTYRLMASDVVSVMNRAGIDRAHVAGWSDGGNIGLLLALDFPTRVDRLVVISANYHPDGIADDILNQFDDSPDAAISSLSRWLYKIRSPAPNRWPDLVQYVTSLWASYPQLIKTDLNAVTARTLVIVGSEDYVELSHSEQMAGFIPDASLVVVSGIGHSVTRDAPERVCSELIGFLQR